MAGNQEYQWQLDLKRREAIRPDGTRIPLMDASENFLVQPSEDDIRNAVPQDELRCMYCLAVKRQLVGSKMVQVSRTRAFVEQKRAGQWIMLRYAVKGVARKNIEKFDKLEPVSDDAVIFAAPKGSERLDPPKPRKATVKGVIKGGKIKPRGKPRALPPGIELRRAASGLFHFHRE